MANRGETREEKHNIRQRYIMIMPFTELFRHSTIPRPTLDSFIFCSEDSPVQVPLSTRLHAGLVRKAISDRNELCIVTPTAKTEHLYLLALDTLILQTKEKRNIVFVLSSDTGVRERFLDVKPSEKSTLKSHPYSEVEMAVANVTPEGKLSSKTESARDDAYPRFVFSYTSKRIPSDIVAERVACVLFDDSVKVTDERLETLRSWRHENDIPTIVYFTSDPLGDPYETVQADADIWTWPTELLHESLRSEDRRRRGLKSLNRDYSPSDDEVRITEQLRNRADDVEIEVNVPGGEEVEELFGSVQEEQFNFEKLAHELDSNVLWNARSSIRYAIREFEELLAPIKLTEIHSSRRSIEGRLNQLERYTSTLSSDPDGSPALGTYRDVLTTLKTLREKWSDVPRRQKKEGQLVAHLMAISDSNESVAVVTSSETNTQSVATFLQSEYSNVYSQLGDDLSIHGPDSIRRATPVDHVLLYGPPRYRQRDLLRLSVSPHLLIFAYPTELRLLQSQIETLNAAFEEATEHSSWQLSEVATGLVCSKDDSPTPERVDVLIPDPDERQKSGLSSDIKLRREGEEADLADLVRTFDPDYLSTDEDPIADSQNQSATNKEAQTNCVVLYVEGGGKLYYRPTQEVSILRSEDDTIVTKEAQTVSADDLVLHFEDTEDMREKLYELIRNRGDAQLAFYAASWRVYLEQAIEERGDGLDQFIARVNDHLDPDDHKTRQTYRRWYNLGVRRTRAKKSMRAIATAYDLTFVQENFDAVWNAVHTMESLYQKLKEALSEHALRSLTKGKYEDVTVSEHPRIQLSDFDVERHLHQCTVSNKEIREVPAHQIGTYKR